MVKNPPAKAGDAGSVPGSGRSPGEGKGSPLQDSRLENPVDRGACCAAVHGVPKSQTGDLQLNNDRINIRDFLPKPVNGGLKCRLVINGIKKSSSFYTQVLYWLGFVYVTILCFGAWPFVQKPDPPPSNAPDIDGQCPWKFRAGLSCFQQFGSLFIPENGKQVSNVTSLNSRETP